MSPPARRNALDLLAGLVVYALMVALLFVAGCAAFPVERTPVTPAGEIVTSNCAKALGVVGRTACAAVLGLTPGATELLDQVDGTRARVAERTHAAKERKAAADLAARRTAFCTANPEYGPCAAIVEAALGLSATQDVVAGDGGTAAIPRGSHAAATTYGGRDFSVLRATIKRAEGGFRPAIVDGHVCAGHSVVANDDLARFVGRVLTEAECAIVLDEDIAAALGRARDHLGCASDACIELCYVAGCSQWKETRGDELYAAVREAVKPAARAERIVLTMAAGAGI